MSDPIDPQTLDATLQVLKRHNVAVFKSEAFSVELDPSAFGVAEAPEVPGSEEAAREAAQREYERVMYRSAG